VSKAKGFVSAARLRGEPARVFVLTGDGELQEGQFWESLQGAANHRMHEITTIVDHNKMQSDTWVQRVSALGRLEAKFEAFGWHVERCSGHDLATLSAVLARCRAITDRPKAIIADTVKGRGVKAMENTALGEDELYRFHSGAPASEVYQASVQELVGRINARLNGLGQEPLSLERPAMPSRPPASGQRLVAAYSRALVKQAGAHPKLVALDADLMLDCGLIPFRERFPDRFIECGIAEQDMVSHAGALALRGFLPVVHSFACFLSTRPNEQIYNNATERTKLIYVGSLAGLLPGGPGHSHQSLRDIGALAAVPELLLIEPCTEEETELAFDFCVNHAKSSCYLRLVSVPCDVPYALPPGYALREGRGTTLVPGSDAAVVAYGPVLLAQAFLAIELLAKRGLRVELINLPWLNLFDDDWLRELAARHRRLILLDNHYVRSGQGEMLLARLAALGLLNGVRALQLGVDGIPACGTNDEVLRAHGLDAASIAAQIRTFCSTTL
jgi:transketolase